MPFRIPTLLVTIGALGLSAPAAVATPRSWSTPATLTPHGNASGGSHVSLAENGDAVSLWTIGYGVKGVARATGVRPLLAEAHEVVQAAIRPAGGSYGAVQTLSNPEATAYAHGVATAADGEAVAVWSQDQVGESTGENAELEYAVRPAGATAFGAPKVLPESGGGGKGASIAMNPAGEAVIAWSGAGEKAIQYLTRTTGGAFSAIGTVKAPAGVGFGDVYDAIDAHGDAVISWNADAEPTPKAFTGQVEAIQLAHGGTFGAPVDLSAAGVQDYSPRPAIDGSGNATLVWIVQEENPATKNPGYKVQARTLSSAGTLGTAPQTLSAFGVLPEEPRIGADPAGEATAVWTHVVGSTAATEAAILPTAGGNFGGTTVLDPSAGSFTSDALTVSETGESMALWAHLDNSIPEHPTEQLVEATRTPGGSFAPALAVSAAGPEFFSPSIALDTAGDAAASWIAFGESSLFEQTSNFVVPTLPVANESPGNAVTTKQLPTIAPFTLSLRAAKPSLAKFRKGTPIKVTCTLDAPGTCTVQLLISAATARKLGFHVAKHAKTLTIGSVKITFSAAGAKTAPLKLSSSALKRIKRDRRPLSLQVSASAGSVAGRTATVHPLALSIH